MEKRRFPIGMIRDRKIIDYKHALNLPYELSEKIFKPGNTILDLGCGRGYFVNGILENGFDIYGTDINITKTAGERIKTAPFYKQPFKDLMFDGIVSVAAQGFYVEQKETVTAEYEEIYRILKPGGRYVQVVAPFIHDVSPSIIVELQRINNMTSLNKSYFHMNRREELYKAYYKLTLAKEINEFLLHAGEEGYRKIKLYDIGKKAGLKIVKEWPVHVNATSLLGCIVVEWVKPIDNQIEP